PPRWWRCTSATRPPARSSGTPRWSRASPPARSPGSACTPTCSPCTRSPACCGRRAERMPDIDLTGGRPARRYRNFVAVGDSFTEGLSDPGANGAYRGWADRVAERLAALEPGFRYANLAVRGKLLDQIV